VRPGPVKSGRVTRITGGPRHVNVAGVQAQPSRGRQEGQRSEPSKGLDAARTRKKAERAQCTEQQATPPPVKAARPAVPSCRLTRRAPLERELAARTAKFFLKKKI
jgi:hypothetical protein